MGQDQSRRPVAAFSDPFAGEPLRGDGADVFSDPYAGEPLRMATKSQKITATDVAPTVGGMVGGMVGGIPGAAIGGAAGQGIGTLLSRGAEIPGALADVARNLVSEPGATFQGLHEGIAEGATDAAKAAGIQGISEYAGGKVAQVGGVLAKWLMNRATTRVTARLTREFPDLADTLIDNALTVSNGGYEKARKLLAAAKAKANTALSLADDAGARIPVELNEDIAESFKTALLEDVIKSRGLEVSDGAVTSARNRLPEHLRGLFQQIDDALASGQPLSLKPSQSDLLKRRLQQESRPTYANRNAPNGPRAMKMSAEELADYAAQLNAKIDAVAEGYKAANAEARPLIGATRGLKQAIRPSGNLYQAMVRPGVGAAAGFMGSDQMGVSPLAGAAMGAVMTSPGVMSRQAIILRDPRVQQLLRQLPRASALALTELLGELSRTQTADPTLPAGGGQ